MSLRFVCISDLHLGARSSILTPARAPSGGAGASASATDAAAPDRSALEAYGRCLRALALSDPVSPPTLVINGDLLEMALSSLSNAANALDYFLSAVLGPEETWPFADRIVFLAGNHDHHLWESARESWHFEQIRHQQAHDYLPPVPHVTDVAGQIGDSIVIDPLLTALIRRHPALARCEVQAAYPNFGVYDATRGRQLIFHHGHFIETAYHLVSKVRTFFFPGAKSPEDIAGIESENFAWIDFFWSTLGRSGDAGQDVSLIYDKMRSWDEIRWLLHNVAVSVVGGGHSIKGFIKGAETAMLSAFLDATLGRLSSMEVHQSGEPLTKAAAEGLTRYVEGPLRRQVEETWGQTAPNTTLVLGHTHKPFEMTERFDGFAGEVEVFNSGGYFVDTPEEERCHGGSLILVNDELETVAVRMYAEDALGRRPFVAQTQVVDGARDAFAAEIAALIEANPEPWDAFATSASRQVQRCRDVMKDRIVQRDEELEPDIAEPR
jgi:hypothetical protein